MRVRVVQGRVAEQSADALVRVAPRDLVGHRPDDLLAAAGPVAQHACRTLRHTVLRAGLPAGTAVCTGAGALHATWLIHVAVPRYSVAEDRDHLLAAAYRAVLATADEVLATTVAMAPLGTTGPYWPLEDVIRIGLGTLAGTLTRVHEVRLVLVHPAGVERFAEALARG